MAGAVDRAAGAATDGDVVLLAPGCASFGLFRDEFDRGQQFRETVAAMAAETGVPDGLPYLQGEVSQRKAMPEADGPLPRGPASSSRAAAVDGTAAEAVADVGRATNGRAAAGGAAAGTAADGPATDGEGAP